LRKKALGLYFCGILDTAAVQDCTKFPSLITNVLLHLVRDFINGVCYQRYEKRLEQQTGRPKVNVCAAAENLEEELQGVYKVWVHGKKHIKSGTIFLVHLTAGP